MEEEITLEDVRNYILYNYHLSAANNIEMELIAGEEVLAENTYNLDLVEKHKIKTEKYKLPEVIRKILVIDNNLAHAIEDLRRETEGIDLLPICPNFDELKVKEIAKKILDMKSK